MVRCGVCVVVCGVVLCGDAVWCGVECRKVQNVLFTGVVRWMWEERLYGFSINTYLNLIIIIIWIDSSRYPSWQLFSMFDMIFTIFMI